VIAPVEAAVQPVLTTVTDTVGTLTNDVAGVIAPVEAAVQPVLTTVTNTVGTSHAPATAGMVVDGGNAVLALPPSSGTDSSSHGDTSSVATHHIGSAGSVSGTGTPVLPDLVDVLQVAAPDTTSGLTDHVVASAAPVVDVAAPLLATTAGAASQSTTSSQTAASDSAGPHTFGSSASPAPHVAEPAPATGNDATGDVALPGYVASDVSANAASVVNTTEPVLASAGVSLSNLATDLLQPAVPDTSTDQAPGPAETLLALATATDAPIEVSGATAAPNIVTDLSNAATVVDAIAGDVIALNDVKLPPVNPLFTGTQYTDYGVTLSSEIAVPPQHAASAADAASTQDTLVPVIADVQQHAPPPPDIVDTTHLIDHLGIREAIL